MNEDMWSLNTHWYEIVLRTAIVFSFILVAFRFWGKKHLGQLAPFDLVILLIISEAVQNALIGSEKGVPAALISVSTLILLTSILNKITFKSLRIEKIIDGTPKIIIKNGIIDRNLMIREAITKEEFEAALRMQGVLKVEDVLLGTLETTGELSIIKMDESFKTHGPTQQSQNQ